MKPITYEQFDRWMAKYGQYSAENDPEGSAKMYAPEALYYESPFEAPLVGRKAIYQYWKKGAENLVDKSSTYEILAVKDNLGIARWRSQFTARQSGKSMALDCLFLVEFDEKGKCRLFREWWHIQESMG